MNATKKLLLLAALAVPTTVFANEGAHIDGYYIPSSKIDVSFDAGPGFPNGFDADDDGDGFGAKAWVPFGRTQNFFLEGEYQSTSYDDSDTDLDQLRLGAGWQIPLQTGTLALYGEYVDLKVDEADVDADGFGVHARLAFPIARNVQLYGQAGYLSLDDQGTYDGFEFLVGGSIDITRNIGAFIDYRHTDLSGDIDYTIGDLRVGVRVLFDTGRM